MILDIHDTGLMIPVIHDTGYTGYRFIQDTGYTGYRFIQDAGL